ncbi:fip1-like 1 protein [Anaeramoeba flamelloides]|uniref:Fip1-like 1 protein n=1 Tax=Anaeramoeba flamelloides TaxID=1746091 RepID=A0ABQ8XNL1_9EUKA|nr:fip1-like 1 protein [Anaeramoeba flamelloides]
MRNNQPREGYYYQTHSFRNEEQSQRNRHHSSNLNMGSNELSYNNQNNPPISSRGGLRLGTNSQDRFQSDHHWRGTKNNYNQQQPQRHQRSKQEVVELQKERSSIRLSNLTISLYNVEELAELVREFGQIMKIHLNDHDHSAWIRFIRFDSTRKAYHFLKKRFHRPDGVQVYWPYLQNTELGKNYSGLEDDFDTGIFTQPKHQSRDFYKRLEHLIEQIDNDIDKVRYNNTGNVFEDEKIENQYQSDNKPSLENEKNNKKKKSSHKNTKRGRSKSRSRRKDIKSKSRSRSRGRSRSRSSSSSRSKSMYRSRSNSIQKKKTENSKISKSQRKRSQSPIREKEKPHKHNTKKREKSKDSKKKKETKKRDTKKKEKYSKHSKNSKHSSHSSRRKKRTTSTSESENYQEKIIYNSDSVSDSDLEFKNMSKRKESNKEIKKRSKSRKKYPTKSRSRSIDKEYSEEKENRFDNKIKIEMKSLKKFGIDKEGNLENDYPIYQQKNTKEQLFELIQNEKQKIFHLRKYIKNEKQKKSLFNGFKSLNKLSETIFNNILLKDKHKYKNKGKHFEKSSVKHN